MQPVNRRWWERFRCVSVKPRPGFTNSLCDHLAWDEHEPPQCEARRPAPHPACEAPLLGGRHSHPGGHRGSRLDPSRQEAAGCGRSPEGGRQALRRSDGGAPSQSSWFKSAHGLSAACPPPRVSAFPTVEQAQDGRRRTCRHPSSAQRWPQPCDPRCSPRGEGHVSSPAQAGLRAPTCADGGGQSVHESRERLAGGRGAVRGGRGAAQQVDPPRVLPELLQVPRQQAELLALRPALLLQLPHPALRERRAQSAGAGRRGCTCEGERAVSVRAACHVCMWPVCTCVHVS